MSRRDDLRVEFAKAIVAGLYADPTVTEIDTVKICDEAERMADEITRRETAGAEARKQAEDNPLMMICPWAAELECSCTHAEPHEHIASCNSILQKCPACITVGEAAKRD